MSPSRPDPTRKRLLHAAERCFARHGYEGATIERIARDAKVNNALISYHFGGKLKLYHAVIASFLERAEGELVPPRGETATERLTDWLRQYFDFLQAHPAFPQILAREQMAGAPRMDGALTGRFFRFFGRTRELLEAGVANGEFRDLDTHSAHLALAGATVYFQLTREARNRYHRSQLVDVELLSPALFRDTLITLFLNGILNPQSDR